MQFAAAGADNVDFGVLEPEDFADNNAPIVTAIQYAGLRTAAGSTNLPAVVANPWVVPANDPTPPANTTYPGRVDLASYGAVGSVWGTAFNRPQNAAYAAATYKRVSDMGPLGLGGIYRIPNVVNQTTGALNPSPVPLSSGWTWTTRSRGRRRHISTNRLLGAPNALVRDPDAYTKAGKVGIGGIAVSEDGSTLFFVNLLDKTLYAVNLPADGSKPTSATPIPLDLGAGQRPWAVAVHRDRVYVGYVDTGGDGATPGLAATGNFYVVSQPVAGGAGGRLGYRAPELHQGQQHHRGVHHRERRRIPSDPPRESAGPGHALELLDRQLVLGDQRVRRLQHQLWMDPHLPAGHPGQPGL